MNSLSFVSGMMVKQAQSASPSHVQKSAAQHNIPSNSTQPSAATLKINNKKIEAKIQKISAQFVSSYILQLVSYVTGIEFTPAEKRNLLKKSLAKDPGGDKDLDTLNMTAFYTAAKKAAYKKISDLPFYKRLPLKAAFTTILSPFVLSHLSKIGSVMIEAVVEPLVGRVRNKLHSMSKQDYANMIDASVRLLNDILLEFQKGEKTAQRFAEIITSKLKQEGNEEANKDDIFKRLIHEVTKLLNVKAKKSWTVGVTLWLVRNLLSYAQSILKPIFYKQINQLMPSPEELQKMVIKNITSALKNLSFPASNTHQSNSVQTDMEKPQEWMPVSKDQTLQENDSMEFKKDLTTLRQCFNTTFEKNLEENASLTDILNALKDQPTVNEKSFMPSAFSSNQPSELRALFIYNCSMQCPRFIPALQEIFQEPAITSWSKMILWHQLDKLTARLESARIQDLVSTWLNVDTDDPSRKRAWENSDDDERALFICACAKENLRSLPDLDKSLIWARNHLGITETKEETSAAQKDLQALTACFNAGFNQNLENASLDQVLTQLQKTIFNTPDDMRPALARFVEDCAKKCPRLLSKIQKSLYFQGDIQAWSKEVMSKEETLAQLDLKEFQRLMSFYLKRTTKTSSLNDTLLILKKEWEKEGNDLNKALFIYVCSMNCPSMIAKLEKALLLENSVEWAQQVGARKKDLPQQPTPYLKLAATTRTLRDNMFAFLKTEAPKALGQELSERLPKTTEKLKTLSEEMAEAKQDLFSGIQWVGSKMASTSLAKKSLDQTNQVVGKTFNRIMTTTTTTYQKSLLDQLSSTLYDSFVTAQAESIQQELFAQLDDQLDYITDKNKVDSCFLNVLDSLALDQAPSPAQPNPTRPEEERAFTLEEAKQQLTTTLREKMSIISGQLLDSVVKKPTTKPFSKERFFDFISGSVTKFFNSWSSYRKQLQRIDEDQKKLWESDVPASDYWLGTAFNYIKGFTTGYFLMPAATLGKAMLGNGLYVWGGDIANKLGLKEKMAKEATDLSNRVINTTTDVLTDPRLVKAASSRALCTFVEVLEMI